ncbi:YfgM family protein [Buchnera aphidicola]|uniref:YfgM family protein n=1 Tax=Buchnera aphidicola TaxID=9 RepID=UPI003464A266
MHLNQIKKIKKIKFLILFFVVITTFFIYFFTIQKKQKLNFKKIQYEEIIKKINAKKNQNLNKIENYILEKKNIYGTLISLFLAKKYISDNKLDKAVIQLNNGLKYVKEENIKNMIKLRIAKIKIQEKKHEEAIKILKEIKDNNWKNIVENMKGDIFMNEKKIKKAILAWETSKIFEKNNTFKEIINIKINEAKNKINANLK